ncbi:helix-turn-helix transcriptional regulator [Brevundimonas mediterranea]|uniref:Helix-turn-helix transcriptional regulator n=1 Tax=Brevundimonas mediterranea TaxID=74329 RepID=A0AB37EB80_9CAUL|nr:helix-turn-helix transcriptional regulator [Brevundimonas mediterranea]QIH74559.1 helix-turn-helix transcriptional regulator [Brevundimonas mediterranea]
MNGRALVAWNLRRLRTERGLSQERLAADTGVDRAYVSELERAQANASVDLLDRLAEVLTAPLAEFFMEPQDPENPPAALRSGRRPKNG